MIPSAVLAWFGSSLLRRHVTRLYWLPVDNGAKVKSGQPQEPDGGRDCCEGATSQVLVGSHSGLCSNQADPTAALNEVKGDPSGGRSAPHELRMDEVRRVQTLASHQELLEDLISSNAGRMLQKSEVSLRLQCLPRSLEQFLQVSGDEGATTWRT